MSMQRSLKATAFRRSYVIEGQVFEGSSLQMLFKRSITFNTSYWPDIRKMFAFGSFLGPIPQALVSIKDSGLLSTGTTTKNSASTCALFQSH